jgi:hemoglobin
MVRSMLERYGGFPILSRIVLGFYDNVLDSDVLAPYFEDIDMRRLVDHQTKFMAFLMGGPASYTNEHLAHIHAPLGIDRPAFDEMIVVMRDTLESFAIADEDVATVIHELRSRAPWIIAMPSREAASAGG